MAQNTRLFIIPFLFALVLLGAFFIGWVKWEDIAVPGYAMPSGEFFSVSEEKFGLANPYPGLNILLKLFWLIPAGCLAVILLSAMKKNSTWIALFTGAMALSLCTIFILFSKTLLMLGVGSSLGTLLAPGLFIAILGGAGLIFSAVRTTMLIRILLFIAGPLIAWLSFLFIEKKTMEEKYTDTAEVESAYTVWSQDLIREFRENDSLANAKYREQILTVRGRISETEMPNDSTVNIKMADSTGSYAIFPLLDSYAQKAGELKPGDSVVIRGSCSGGMYSEILETETISFKRCALIQ